MTWVILNGEIWGILVVFGIEIWVRHSLVGMNEENLTVDVMGVC